MKIGFIGCGNMGGALARAIAATGEHTVYLSDLDEARAQTLATAVSATVADADTLVRSCDFVFLGVKPYGIRPLLESLSDSLAARPDTVLVSMAAGVTVAAIQEALSTPHPIVRILPNTPVALGEGMTVYATSDDLDAAREQEFVSLMRPTGRLDRLSESLIDTACVVSGCGPAYAYMFLDALARAGERGGLPYETAKCYAAQMMRGAASMVLASEKTPRTLREEVCSPGGSTIEGVRVLEADGLDALIDRAFDASLKRTRELGQK